MPTGFIFKHSKGPSYSNCQEGHWIFVLSRGSSYSNGQVGNSYSNYREGHSYLNCQKVHFISNFKRGIYMKSCWEWHHIQTANKIDTFKQPRGLLHFQTIKRSIVYLTTERDIILKPSRKQSTYYINIFYYFNTNRRVQWRVMSQIWDTSFIFFTSKWKKLI